MTYDGFKEVIRAQGMTMEDLAEKMGMSRPTLQNRLQYPKSMTITEVESLSKILKIEDSLITH